MRPRSMRNIPGLNDSLSPFERFKRFAGMIVSVPKAEADKEIERAANDKRANGTKRKRNGKLKEKAFIRPDKS
jgi:hypothetical protein